MNLLLQRLLVFILVFVLLLQCINCPVRVYGSETEYPTGSDDLVYNIIFELWNSSNDNKQRIMEEFFNLGCSATGIITDPVSTFGDAYVETARFFLEKMGIFYEDENGNGYLIENDYVYLDKNGNLIFTEEYIKMFADLLSENIGVEPYKYYNVYSTDYINTLAIKDYIKNDTTLLSFMEYYDRNAMGIGSGKKSSSSKKYDFLLGDRFMYAYLGSDNKIFFLDYELNPVNPILRIDHTYINTALNYDEFLSVIDEYGEFLNTSMGVKDNYLKMGVTSFYYCGTNFPVFNSIEDLYAYVKGKPVAYYTSNYNNGTYQDIVLNQETLNNYTTENIQNIYNNIYNNTQNCTNADELQKIIDDTVSKELEKMNETLEDVEDDTSDMVGLLKSIDSNIKLLVAIDTADLLYDIYGDESMIRDLVDLPQKMTSFELMKKKFPFSIPWDIIHIFDMFAHEPVAPDFHFTLPIAIGNGEIYEFDLHIDLTGEDWKKVSDLSRFFLLATFIVFLYRFTYRK